MERASIVVMTPFGRSGSVALHGSFDNHEEVATLPTYANVYDFYADAHDSFSPEEYWDCFEKNTPGLFDLEEGLLHPVFVAPLQQAVRNIDREQFRSTFLALCEICGDCGRKEYFLLLHVVVFLLRGRLIEQLKCIVIHMHYFHVIVHTRSGERLSTEQKQHVTLFRDFPRAVFLVCLRDPVYSAGRIIILHKRPEYSNSSLMQSRRLSFEGELTHWESVCSVVRTHSLCLQEAWQAASCVYVRRLEEVHRDPAGSTRHLCSFLGIRYDPDFLLKTTFSGNSFESCSGTKRRAHYGPEVLTDMQWKYLTEWQRALIRLYFRGFLVAFYPEEVKSFFVEIAAALRGVLRDAFQKRSPQQEEGKEPGILQEVCPRCWRDVLYLLKIGWTYFGMRKLRSLDRSRAVFFKASNG
jgi:hypothetical protein